MPNEINLNQRIAALQKQNKQLREQLDKSAIPPRVQANLYMSAVRNEVSLIKFILTGCLSNAAWRLVEKELTEKERKENHIAAAQSAL